MPHIHVIETADETPGEHKGHFTQRSTHHETLQL